LKRWFAVALGLMLIPTESNAVPTRREPARALESSTPERLAADFDRYARWLVQLNEVLAPEQEAMAAVQPLWYAAVASGEFSEFRVAVAQGLRAIDGVDAAVAELALPQVAGLGLPDDIEPAGIVRAVREQNRHARALFLGFEPVIAAIERGDERERIAADQRLLRTANLLLRSQVLLLRASLASTPREESSWEMVNIQPVLMRAIERLAGALVLERGTNDSALERDLLAFAAELQESARAGAAKLAAEEAQHRLDLAGAERDGDATAASLLRRVMAAGRVGSEIFALALEAEGLLRGAAPRFASGQAAVGDVLWLVMVLRPLRLRLDALGRQEAEALAGAD
jgi:hypothetical protein